MIMGRDDHSYPGCTLPGVAVRRIPGRLSVSWDVASLLPGGR
jgi:hypothetical protein